MSAAHGGRPWGRVAVGILLFASAGVLGAVVLGGVGGWDPLGPSAYVSGSDTYIEKDLLMWKARPAGWDPLTSPPTGDYYRGQPVLRHKSGIEHTPDGAPVPPKEWR